jgi:hypothetical protein
MVDPWVIEEVEKEQRKKEEARPRIYLPLEVDYNIPKGDSSDEENEDKEIKIEF